MGDELKACGHCGGRDLMAYEEQVVCGQCGATAHRDWWNRRVVTREQVEKMARELVGGRATDEDTCEARFNVAAMLLAAGFEVAE